MSMSTNQHAALKYYRRFLRTLVRSACFKFFFNLYNFFVRNGFYKIYHRCRHAIFIYVAVYVKCM